MKWTNKGHEFDDIGYLLKDKKQVFLYGMGDVGAETFNFLNNIKKWINWEIHLVDNDRQKQINGYKGNKILSPEKFFNMKKDEYFVIICASEKVTEEIKSIICKNLDSDIVCFESLYFINNYLSIYFSYMHDMVFFSFYIMLISSICNLNCRDCLNFNPYIKNHYNPNFNELKMDIDTFFSVINLVYYFQITGGEPLLSKNLIPVLKYINDNYSDRIVRLELVTNGTVMPSDELCQFLSENNIYVYLDDYRCAVPEKTERYYAVYGKLSKYKVKFFDNNVDKWMRMYIPSHENKYISEKDLIRKFVKCNVPWSTLQSQKISSCNYAMYADKAGLCKADESEYYDLSSYNKEKQRELIEFRLKYIEKGYNEFCKKCLGWKFINDNWCEPAVQISKEKINEMDK